MKSEALELLESNKGRIFSIKEVSKELDSKLYEKDKTWAARELKQLWSKGLIEAINGCYWIPDKEDKKSEPEEKGVETEQGTQPTGETLDK